jgi:hypothetical protein
MVILASIIYIIVIYIIILIAVIYDNIFIWINDLIMKNIQVIKLSIISILIIISYLYNIPDVLLIILFNMLYINELIEIIQNIIIKNIQVIKLSLFSIFNIVKYLYDIIVYSYNQLINITIKIVTTIKILLVSVLNLLKYLYKFIHKCKNIIICICIDNDENYRNNQNLYMQIVELKQQLTQEKLNNSDLRRQLNNNNSENIKCSICFTSNISKCCVPCGHTYCSNCIVNTNNCYICRSHIQQKITIFI